MGRQNGNGPPEPTPEPKRLREPGRLRAAWSVLLGERLVPVQLQAEWAEYQQIFDDLLKRLSAQLARQAKAEKARLERQLEGSQAPAPVQSGKLLLYQRAAAARGLLRPHHPSQEDHP